jgi:putative acetyltransferase
MAPAGYTLRSMEIADYPAVRSLWERTEGMGLNESDTPEAIALFLGRNPGLSLLITAPDGRTVGAVLCGHDGRRGYLHHLAVATTERGRGLGRELVDGCLCRLRSLGIPKCNIYLFATNAAGRSFWLHEGWTVRDDLIVMQRGSCGC